MSYGVEILNGSADVVIDGTYANHSIWASGSYTASSSLGTIDTVSFPAIATPPLIFVHSTVVNVAFLGLTQDGSGNYNGFQTISGNGAGGTVDYFVAAPDPSASAATWGLRVWDPSGNLVFDSGKTYLHLEDAVSFTPPAIGSPVTVTHASVTTPYYLLNLIGATATSLGGGVYALGRITVRNTSSTTADVEIQQIGDVLGPGGYIPSPQTLVVASLP